MKDGIRYAIDQQNVTIKKLPHNSNYHACDKNNVVHYSIFLILILLFYFIFFGVNYLVPSVRSFDN
jgi:hypothetical protein